MKPVALTIAGSDPSGGAGIQADLKTFHQFGVYGMSVVTLLTVQNTQHLRRAKILEASFVLEQLDALLDDFSPNAAKTGALGSAEIVEAVAERAKHFRFPLVVDPVMVSKHGVRLMEPAAEVLLAQRLLPQAALVTPNIQEAEVLSKRKIEDDASLLDAAKAILQLGVKAVLIKGGHRQDDATDFLCTPEGVQQFAAARLETPHTHGTGCTYSAAITAVLSQGKALADAVSTAKRYVTEAIATAPKLGRGQGPVNHHASF
ncbi:MAG: bifunctional hydroxymethylpyrimidine kinase/phosphomethylpyrimidine kinase [Candidatus Omnitrophota bacterium]